MNETKYKQRMIEAYDYAERTKCIAGIISNTYTSKHVNEVTGGELRLHYHQLQILIKLILDNAEMAMCILGVAVDWPGKNNYGKKPDKLPLMTAK